MGHSDSHPHGGIEQNVRFIPSKTLTLLICFKAKDQPIQDKLFFK